VLGDSPVGATISLGHDDRWRAILSGESYVVAMPLAPDLALLLAPQLLMPVTLEPGLPAITAAINRLSWRHASRFVVARDAETLVQAWPADKESAMRRESAAPPVDPDYIARNAWATSLWIVVTTQYRAAERAGWLHWEGCSLTFGFLPYAAEDRVHAGQPACPGWRRQHAAAGGGRG
jgi:hypothetical protein